MSDFDKKISELQARLENLVKSQEYFYREIDYLRNEINSLKSANQPNKSEPTQEFQKPPETAKSIPVNQTEHPVFQRPVGQNYQTEPPPSKARSRQHSPSEKSNLERFIGQNLISVIGIIVTIIGVAIGAKYAIDNDLISPFARIILGYLFGIALFALAVFLKPKYHNFSAVLLSGAAAIMYFITFFAYVFYGFLSQPLAFLLMLFFTVFTVVAAINYNRQVIAHIGLVGAYAVPFLVGGNSANAAVLFGYIAIINFGILGVSLKTYWKLLFYNSFAFTWLIYSAWYLTSYNRAENFTLAFTFASLFFLTFYVTFIAYKIIYKEKFGTENIALVLANSFIFYGFGYSILNSQPSTEPFLGFFTILNSIFHFAVGTIVYRYALADKSIVNFLTTLALIFLTIAIPVELDGNWVTLLWTAEAAFLFWLGRAKNLPVYEYFSYPAMILASFSLLYDWAQVYRNYLLFTRESAQFPLFNADFLVSILFAAAFAFICLLNVKKKPAEENSFYKFTTFAFPTIFLAALYNTFRIEIDHYFHYQLVNSVIETASSRLFNNDINLFNATWQINYSMFFLTMLSVVNIKKIKSAPLGFVNLALNALMMLIFLTIGLLVLSSLREGYLLQTNAEFFNRGTFHIVIRYIAYVFVAALIAVSYEYIKQEFINRFVTNKNLRLAFDFAFYFSLLWITSSELINLMDIFRLADSDKLGLSILWGVYALFLVILGINRNKKHLRIGAIILFGVTLVKVFFYDIAELGTISRTVIFVSLGILLLIISFLYNKYKHLIFETNES